MAEICGRVHELLACGIEVVFMWVPSHVGLAGNSAADSAAKAAVLLPKSKLTVLHLNYSSHIRTRTLNEWHQSWNYETPN